VGGAPELSEAGRVGERVAAARGGVLGLGESGTGKELVGGSIHELADRRGKPLVKVNCAAFVESLLMSELFGHEKGAFTDALKRKQGRFELADGGTIFLDEIAEISPQTQVALLRVLQDKRFERVGGSETLHVDVRVVCATNKNLEELVRRGEFRLDLYYRLKGVVLELPSLRERREDIPRLIESFAERYSAPGQRTRFNPGAMRYLVGYSWPGNIRELQNFIKSVLLFVEHDVVLMEHIREFGDFFSSGGFDDDVDWVIDSWQSDLANRNEEPHNSVREATPLGISVPKVAVSTKAKNVAPVEYDLQQKDPQQALIEQIVREGMNLSDIKRNLELECIRLALIETAGNVTQAAKLLHMKRPRLSQIISGNEELTALKEELVG